MDERDGIIPHFHWVSECFDIKGGYKAFRICILMSTCKS